MKHFWNLIDDLHHFDLGESDAVVSAFGKAQSLFFDKSGAAVFLNESCPFQSFRLQAEVAVPHSVGFIGLIFGARDKFNYELIYVSPGEGDGIGEIQYDPVMNGSTTWQIYNGPNYQAPFPYYYGEWVKLTLEVHSNSVSVFIGDAVEPYLVVPNLQHGRATGQIGLWGYLPSYILHLSLEDIQGPVNTVQRMTESLSDQGFITDWYVSKPYYANEPIIESDWLHVIAEENGTVNFNRLYRCEENISIQAKSSVYVDEPLESIMSFGYSDELRLWLNEEEIYHGVWRWDPPDSDGRIRSDFAAVPIYWRAGVNTIRAEITNREAIFGWGLTIKTGIVNRNEKMG